jgi:hypothetical protein
MKTKPYHPDVFSNPVFSSAWRFYWPELFSLGSQQSDLPPRPVACSKANLLQVFNDRRRQRLALPSTGQNF